MKNAWRLIRNTMAAVGFILIVGGVGTMDYTAEVGQAGPDYIMYQILAGLLMLIPTVVHVILREMAEYRESI